MAIEMRGCAGCFLHDTEMLVLPFLFRVFTIPTLGFGKKQRVYAIPWQDSFYSRLSYSMVKCTYADIIMAGRNTGTRALADNE